MATQGINAGSVYSDFVIDLSDLKSGINEAKKQLTDLQSTTENALNKVKADGSSKAVNKFKGSVNESTAAMGGFASSAGMLIKVLGTVAVAFASIKGVEFLATGFYNLSRESESLTKTMASTGVIAKKMGYDVQTTFNFIDQLDRTTQFSTDSLAGFTQQMIKAGVPLQDTNEIIGLFQDNLIALPTLTKSFDESLSQLGDSFTTEMAALLNEIGLGDKTWEGMQKAGEASLRSQGKSVTETTAKIEGLRLALKDTEGVGKILGDTIEVQMSKAQKEFKRARIEIGNAFQPVMLEIMQFITPAIRSLARAITSIDWNRVANGVRTFVGWLIVLGRTVWNVISSIPGINMLGNAFNSLKKNTSGAANASESLAKRINETDLKPLQQLNEQTSKAKQNVQDLAKAIEEERRLT